MKAAFTETQGPLLSPPSLLLAPSCLLPSTLPAGLTENGVQALSAEGTLDAGGVEPAVVPPPVQPPSPAGRGARGAQSPPCEVTLRDTGCENEPAVCRPGCRRLALS